MVFHIFIALKVEGELLLIHHHLHFQIDFFPFEEGVRPFHAIIKDHYQKQRLT